MTNNSIDPYAPPKPLEPLPGERKRFRIRRIDSLVPTVLWWCYFAICFGFLVYSVLGVTSLVLNFGLATVISPLGFRGLVQALGLLGLFVYLRKIPLFHSFFWGLVFLLQLGVTLFVPAMFIYRFATNEQTVLGWRTAAFFVGLFQPLPQSYALWRYSSSSSPVWEAPRVQWKKLGQRIGDAIQGLRRA
jgi:hypothetical protein